ncbi:probable inactive leucine-rich repeat receptor-like protein kinase At3g03770 [Benincasa hispida]|uniref:probable inactive leucine-rich repeat receptor-like protein kinase At3g03770 n=1 Tax=Benincasa hispida TaxID=102211 RepID=UPI0019011C27|nr:probable inactive leucine-rich repeat receptor-like protein kinase At3g03770 [Benincasa hispida]XP_038882584.1 probable inactive leucine-rich repeat receptor-like protein kinase At3g03770 [Benincasa hispida]XP_038882586.1 probable inactive leucine-rich repeat receptor-like protein kinase At3g03770 [Benincasa hispida]
MAQVLHYSVYLLILILFVRVNLSQQFQLSQTRTLLRIQQLLNFPAVLSNWNYSTDFCNLEPDSSVTVVCYEGNMTQLHIIGKKGALLLPHNFSMKSFINTLAKLPDLKVLTLVSLGLWGSIPGKIAHLSSLEILNMSSNFLYGAIPPEISLLSGLRTLILDDNMLAGQLPDWFHVLPLLTVLSLKHNILNGSLPNSLNELENLRVLSLSHNHFYGELPDLSTLTNLQVLELEDNGFGPQFPQLGNKLVTLKLSKNKFRSSIPAEVSSFYQLQHFDVSLNSLVGPLPSVFFSLPSLSYLNISGNKLTGMLMDNISCNDELKVVDLSSNLLTGNLPECLLADTRNRVVLYPRNCFVTGKQQQHPVSFCQNEALAVGIVPEEKKKERTRKAVLALSIVGGIVVVVILLGTVYLLVRRKNEKNTAKKPPTNLIVENPSAGYTSKLLSDARYISQTMQFAPLGLSTYRVLSYEEIEAATKNFDSSAFMGEGSQGQMYRGQLKDGSFVAIRCLKMKRRYSTQNFAHHIDLISKLRHRHLVSALGHCFELYLEDSTVSRIFLVFEYVPNGTLRSWISGRHSRRSLTWTQRIAAAIGIAKGIQFLHTVAGVYSNNIKITDVLLDQNLVAKISSYNLPLMAESMAKVSRGISSGGSKDSSGHERINQEAQSDIYDFGVILLEIIRGRASKLKNEINALREKLQEAISSDSVARKSIVDPSIQNECLDQSLKTMMEVCVRCLLKDSVTRPSLEDVLWNLQFAAQVQDAWCGEYRSSDGSPVSPSLPKLSIC